MVYVYNRVGCINGVSSTQAGREDISSFGRMKFYFILRMNSRLYLVKISSRVNVVGV
jgi:hypothetical protein